MKISKQYEDQQKKGSSANKKIIRKQNEHRQIIVTTDHGRDSVDGKEHGEQSERERTTWIVTNRKPVNDYFTSYQPGIVDILPTIARYLNITIPEKQRWELDGIPLAGPVSVADPEIRQVRDNLVINWRALEKDGEVKIWVSNTNLISTGGADQYQLLTTAALRKQTVSLPLSVLPVTAQPAQPAQSVQPVFTFYKIVIEGKNNAVNRWFPVNNPKGVSVTEK